MREPAQIARQVEEHPQLPAGSCERVSGYGVMGLPFGSGHVLALRRWTASSVGDGFTSVWHRDPEGRWTFYESVADVACTRYFGAAAERVRVGPIGLEWQDERRLHVWTVDSDDVDWRIDLGSTLMTRLMSVLGSTLPMAAWRSRSVLSVLGGVAGPALRVGRVQLTGTTSNGQRFEANPVRIWYVTDSNAVVDGQELGPMAPLDQQAHLADFYIPQRGLFAMGRVFVTPIPSTVDASLSRS